MDSASPEIRTLIEQHDHFRTWRLIGGSSAKEWSHFCVHSDELHLIANLSLVESARESVGRVTVLARSKEWSSSVSEYRGRAARFEAGGHRAELGEQCVRWTGQCYELVLDCPTLKARLSIEPRCVPYLANNLAFEPGASFNWFAVPRCEARGWVELAGVRHELEGAPTYHDHNWGHFVWSSGFSWEWGYSLPRADRDVSVIVSRIGDGNRHHTFTQGLLVWRGARLVRSFRDEEIRLERRGLLRPSRIHRAPAVMNLLVEGSATDVPERVQLRAEGRGDELELEFLCRDLAQIVIPNERGVGVTVINEVVGDLALRGKLGGNAVEQTGHANFEFLSRA